MFAEISNCAAFSLSWQSLYFWPFLILASVVLCTSVFKNIYVDKCTLCGQVNFWRPRSYFERGGGGLTSISSSGGGGVGGGLWWGRRAENTFSQYLFASTPAPPPPLYTEKCTVFAASR